MVVRGSARSWISFKFSPSAIPGSSCSLAIGAPIGNRARLVDGPASANEMEAMALLVDGPTSEGGTDAKTWRAPAALVSTSSSGATRVATTLEVVASATSVSPSSSGATNVATTPEVVATMGSPTGSSGAGTIVTFSDAITS